MFVFSKNLNVAIKEGGFDALHHWMNKLYILAPFTATVAFAVLLYWTAAPNPWRAWDLTEGTDSKCAVHNTKMSKKRVAVIYGVGAPDMWAKRYSPNESFLNLWRQ